MFQIRRAAFLFFTVIFVAFVAAAQDATEPLEVPTEPSTQQVAVDSQVSDSDISDRISKILDATGWFNETMVTADEGVVFIDGVSTTEDAKDWARQLALKTDGVVAVVNRLDVPSNSQWSVAPAVSELRSIADSVVRSLPLVILALLILPAAWLAAKAVAALMRWLLAARISSPFLRQVVARLIAFPVFMLGLYIVLQVAGLTQIALSLLGGAGVVGIVVGFAFRDIAENFLASLILSLSRPFKRGDFISVEGLQGTVTGMNTRSTLLATRNGNEVHIPNAQIFKSVIENFTSKPECRSDFSVGIGYDASIGDAQKVIMQVLQKHDAVLSDPEPLVLVDELAASTVNIKAYFWFDGFQVSPIKLRSALLRVTKTSLTNAGISMPDEAREIIFPDGVPIVSIDQEKQAQSSDPEPPILDVEPEVTEAEGNLKSTTGPKIENKDLSEEKDLLS